MNPQPPVTRMRIAARTSSGKQAALADFPALQKRIHAWRTRAAQLDWTPWLIIALGAFLRLLLLGIKPPHFDEGINGWFVDQMTKTGFYRYDPTNYHGPLHFYVLFLSQTLLGRNIWALRLPVVFVSTVCIYLTLKFETFVGRNASRLAALAMAVSPGFIFYGRYSIHEVWLLLFSMLFAFGLLGLGRFGTSNYLWFAGMGLAGMILTKETYIIHLVCAGLAVPVTWLSHKVTPIPKLKPARQTWTETDLAVVSATAVALIVFFYSGTFFHWAGLKGIYQTFATWYQTGSSGQSGHEKPWPYWLELVTRYEWPVFIGLILCLACQFFKNFAIRYLAIYGVGVFAAYSIVHYKTPWCIISIVWPFLFVFAAGAAAPKVAKMAFHVTAFALIGFGFGLLASYFVQPSSARDACSFSIYTEQAINMTLVASSTSAACGEIGPVLFGSAVICALLGGGVGLMVGRSQSRRISEEMMKAIQGRVLALSLLVSLAIAVSLNYFRYTTDSEPYVYVQTYKDIRKLTSPLLQLAQKNPNYYQLVGHMIRTSAYPFPWILGDFPKIGYYEHDNLPTKMDADFLLVQEDKIEAVEQKLHGSYYTEALTIRPYQDTSKLYLSARVFEGFFPGRAPDFIGKPSQ